MTRAIKILSALFIMAGLMLALSATCIMVILPDWWSFTAGMIGFVLIGIGAVGYKITDHQ